jgi:hypothetical protein
VKTQAISFERRSPVILLVDGVCEEKLSLTLG